MPSFDDEEILEMYARICGREASAMYDHCDGWFQRNYGRLAKREAGVQFLGSVKNLLGLDLGDLRGKTVLDVGCGFGLTCLTMGLLGAREVHGIDVVRGMLDTFKAYTQGCPSGSRIYPALASADAFCYADCSFDLVLSVEALSHFLNAAGFFAEVWRVLKPGAVLIIADDNNGANPSIRKAAHKIWDRFENGPPTDDIYGHRVRVPYVEKRKAIIAEAGFSFADDELYTLSKQTAFMTRAQVLAACRRYLDERILPGSEYRYGSCAVEPESGQFIENLLDPFSIKAELEALGFTVALIAYFGGESRGGAVRTLNSAINAALPPSLTLRYAPGFRIRAIKGRTRRP